jgi:hypothetical protein
LRAYRSGAERLGVRRERRWIELAGEVGIVLRLQVRADMIRKSGGTRRVESALEDVLRAEQREAHEEQCRKKQQ